MTPEEKKDLRRKYAGMAMQGILADNESVKASMEAGKDLNMPFETVIARCAIAYANALIKELEEVEE